MTAKEDSNEGNYEVDRSLESRSAKRIKGGESTWRTKMSDKVVSQGASLGALIGTIRSDAERERESCK